MSTTKETAAECMHLLLENVTLVHELLTTSYTGSESSSHKTQKSIDQLKDRPIHLQVRQGPPDLLPTIDSLIGAMNLQLPDEPCHELLSEARTILKYRQRSLREGIEVVQDELRLAADESSAGRRGVREDDIEKAFYDAVEDVACLYAAIHKTLHPSEGFKRPRTPTRDHGDVTWEGLGSIEFKTYGNSAFSNLIEDCTRNPHFHLWPQVREFVYGETKADIRAGDAGEEKVEGGHSKNKSWKMLAQFIGYGLRNRAGTVVATDFLHHWVVLQIPIGHSKNEVHQIPISSYTIKNSASLPSCLTALMLLFYDQVLSKKTTSIFPEHDIFNPLLVADASLEAESVAVGTSSGMGTTWTYLLHHFQFIVSSLESLLQYFLAASVLYLFMSFKPNFRDSQTGTILFVSKPRCVIYPLHPRRFSLTSWGWPPRHHLLPPGLAFALKVFMHADDFAQEVKAYRDLAGLPGIPELLTVGVSSNGQRFIAIGHVGEPVGQVSKTVVNFGIRCFTAYMEGITTTTTFKAHVHMGLVAPTFGGCCIMISDPKIVDIKQGTAHRDIATRLLPRDFEVYITSCKSASLNAPRGALKSFLRIHPRNEAHHIKNIDSILSQIVRAFLSGLPHRRSSALLVRKRTSLFSDKGIYI
ncbi:hypothetical protein BKA70DRAFT_1430590 [Coprinopsis sp. MPI-PUGE-AT-0042]|nr:hypothetical protein BKA70DRAFT_1430590 [Coprinopsis sp. MPI-PUGE-AT-0042]